LSGEQLLYPALDTISHALESLWNKNKTNDSSENAITSLKLMNRSLLEVINGNIELARKQDLLEASNYAGKAIALTRTAIAHSISYPLTINYKIPHGLACSFTLVPLISDYIQLTKSESERITLNQTQTTLKIINAASRLQPYASNDQILQLIEQSTQSERARNYIFDDYCVESIIKRSLEQ
jgi:alcohol dehydrogenase